MPVEGGLRQSEPAAGVLGPKWLQHHLGRHHVLLGVCQSLHWRRGKPESLGELLLLGHVGPARTSGTALETDFANNRAEATTSKQWPKFKLKWSCGRSFKPIMERWP